MSPAREAAVTAVGVTLRLGTRDIVRDVNFTAHHGDVLCIAGRNGAGKTTLLRAIAGLGPFTGQLHVGGVSAADPAHLRAREVAYVPQRSNLTAALPVERVVEQGRHIYRDALGRLGRKDRHAMDAALAQAGASGLRGRSFAALSYGEQRRVLMARALATGARVLLLDEPTAALDLEQSLRLLELLRRLAAEGYAIVVVLHALDDAIRHTDRTLLLHDGRVEQLGVSREVLSPETIRRVYGVETEEHAGLRFTLPAERTDVGEVKP
jgi:iron complex transport system ATP-binding protein